MEVCLDRFYSSGSFADWESVLGAGLHYHSGFFEGHDTLEEAVQRTVRHFYPQLARGARVFDLGCGWGGPAAMLVEELDCALTCATISQGQAAYCRARGLETLVMDVEEAPIPGHYDTILALESLCHIRDKASLLRRLRDHAGQLILSVNCLQDGSRAERSTFGGSMHQCTPQELQSMLEAAGWTTVSSRNRRLQALPSLLHWKRNLDRRFAGRRPGEHLGVLWDFTSAALHNPLAWAAANPLIDVVAC